MIKRLISFLLTLVLFIAIPLEARYRYNPYTRKLDWYEAAGDITLGDIGDITLTGLATGNVLYYNGTAWVNLATGANTNVLTLAAGIPSWAAPGAPAAHAASHEVGGADLVDHDQLTNYLAAQHLTLPNTLVAVLTDHDAAAHVALGFLALPSTIAAVLTDHNLAAHTALGLFDASLDVDHNQTTNYVAAQHLTLPSTIVAVLTDHDLAAHTALGLYDAPGDVDHNLTTNYAANQHVVLPATIAAVLTDHDLAAHTALGLFDASSDVDHNQTTNYDANKHTDHTAVSVLSAGLISGGGTIDGNQTLTLTEATIEGAIDTLGAVQFTGDVEFLGDITATWGDDGTHMLINHTAFAGVENQALVRIADNREGATVDEKGEAVLSINAYEAWAIYVQKGISQFDYDTIQTEDVFLTWGNTTDHMEIAQTNVTGTDGQPLILIDDDRTGAYANELAEATIYLDAAGTYALNVEAGQAYFQGDTTQIEDVFVTWAEAADKAVITQAAVAGTEDQPLIYIDDDRVGATVDEIDEATLVIESAGTYSTYFKDGTVFFAFAAILESLSDISSTTKLWAKDNAWITWGTLNDWFSDWDNNAGGDDLLVFVAQNYGANDTRALWWSNLNPSGMTDHDDYLSPTFVLTNDEGADANDYSGVVIGERAQANVKVAHYFDFYAMTGASDGSVVSADELPAIFRFGANGTGVPGYSTAGGDVLMEGALEIDGNQQNAGYNRYDYIYWIESFDHGIAANRYSQMWDITSLNTQGNGTNTIDTTPSHITLTTDNNAVGDNEGTITYKQIILRSRLNRSEFSVDLGQTANTQFYCGWNTSQTNAMVAAADEYVIVFFDVSDNANWQIKVGDGATEDVFTSAVAGDTNEIRHEIWVEADGTVHWRVNGTELDITGSVDNLMTANGHYLIVCQAQSVTGAAAIVAEMCYVENEKTKAN